MTVSSRTPEGEPHLCPICGAMVVTEPSDPLGDSLCPQCGSLLLKVRDSLQAHLGRALERIDLDSNLANELGADSLEAVELAMELEEEFGIIVPDDEAEKLQTVADVLRLIRKLRRDQGLED